MVGHQAEGDLYHGGDRGSQSDVKQGGPFYVADQVDGRDAGTEGPNDSLHHNEKGFAAAVKVAHTAKENGGEQAVDGVGLQVGVGGGDNQRLPGENGGQQGAAEKCQRAHSGSLAASAVRMP